MSILFVLLHNFQMASLVYLKLYFIIMVFILEHIHISYANVGNQLIFFYELFKICPKIPIFPTAQVL